MIISKCITKFVRIIFIEPAIGSSSPFYAVLRRNIRLESFFTANCDFKALCYYLFILNT